MARWRAVGDFLRRGALGLTILVTTLAAGVGTKIFLVPGRDTGFEPERDASRPSVLSLVSDLGGDSAWIALVVRSQHQTTGVPPNGPGDSTRFVAHHAGNALAAYPTRRNDGSWRVDVAAPDANPGARRMFYWQLGVPVLVTASRLHGATPGTVPLKVLSWQVWTPKERYDSSQRARNRKIVEIVTLIGVIAGAGLAVLQGLREDKQKPTTPEGAKPEPGTAPLTADVCLRLLVDEIGRAPHADAVKEARVLEMTLLGTTGLDEVYRALDAGPDAAWSARKRAVTLIGQARRHLADRIDALIGGLDAATRRIGREAERDER
jgi:hypothetical protein